MGNYGDPMSQEEIREHRKRQAMLRKKEEKAEKRSKVRKFFLLLFVFIFVFVFYEKGLNFNFDFKLNFDFFKKQKKSGEATEKAKDATSLLTGKFIAYIPMDDRSIHTTRMIYLAESSGYSLKMPDTKFYKTYLESGSNSYNGYSTKYGNPSKLATWLLDMENAGCDYYILSLDQLFFGGIAGSRYLDDADFKVYGRGADAAQKALTKIMSDKKNHVYLIDSIAGVSPIPGFMDFTEEDYKLLVEYSQKDRKTASDLSIDSIAENYILDPNGNSYTTELNLEKLNRYLAARERKLTYSKSLMDSISNIKKQENIHLIYGIDDSGNDSVNIQKNDVSFIKNVTQGTTNPVVVRDGLSSLSEEVFAEMLLDAIDQEITVKVRYYGDSNQVVSNSKSTYAGFMNDLLSDMGLKSDEKGDIEVLVYTKNDVPTRVDSSKKLLTQYLLNVKNHVPTIIINDAASDDAMLTNYLIDYSSTSIPMGYLIGYSSWNGYIHSSRIALAEGVTRYLYLTQKSKNDTSDKGFLKGLSYGFIEDIAYLPSHNESTDLRVLEANMDSITSKIRKNLATSNYVSNLVSYEEKGIKSIDTYNYKFPWGRTKEIDFDVSVAMDTKAHSITIPESVEEKQAEE